jgi:hypothetical protein
MVASVLGLLSTEITSHPNSAKAFPTEPVPEKSSKQRILYGTLANYSSKEKRAHKKDGCMDPTRIVSHKCPSFSFLFLGTNIVLNLTLLPKIHQKSRRDTLVSSHTRYVQSPVIFWLKRVKVL